MKINSTRRQFIWATASFGAFISNTYAMNAILSKKKWYKGNLHMHTRWSDGKAFPEEAVMWYKSRGYNFIGISDHNLFQDNPNKFASMADPEKKLRGFSQKELDRYVANYPDAEVGTGKDGRKQVRLKTFDELSKIYNSDGEFVMIPNVEATRGISVNGSSHQLHMNYVNLPGLLPSYKSKGFKWGLNDGTTVAEFLGQHARETAEFAKTFGKDYLFILNHPIWMWYDVGPEAVVANPDVRFFELCNGGSPWKPAEGLPTDGFDTDRFWDVVNAFRARRGQKLLYGVGTDDTHFYHGEKNKMCIPGNAWSLVRSNELTADAIVKAMNEGDFVTCEGIEPKDVYFDSKEKRLDVSVEAKPTVKRTIKFIVSKADFSETPVKTLTISRGNNSKFNRTINIYDEKVGMVVKTVEGKVGEALSASYVMQKDDLYVRARIEEDGQPICTANLHPQGKFVAWTQPYGA